MFKKLKKNVYMLSAAISLLMPLGFGVATTYAASGGAYNVQNSLQNQGCAGSQAQVGGSSGACTGTQAADSLSTLVKNILNVFSWVVGIVAVIMIIIAGFRYIVSGGESGGVTGAKNAILFAIVGIVIVAIAQIIVQFVLTKATSTNVTQ
jgi:cytochrome bd-type quinol oxidase subunit 2